MKILKLILSSFVMFSSIQIFAEISNLFEFQNTIELDRVLAKVSRTDQDYSDKYFTGLSFHYDPEKQLQDKEYYEGNRSQAYNGWTQEQINDYYARYGYSNQGNAQWTQQQLNDYYARYGYQNSNFGNNGYTSYNDTYYTFESPRDGAANRQIETDDWGQQMKARNDAFAPSAPQSSYQESSRVIAY